MNVKMPGTAGFLKVDASPPDPEDVKEDDPNTIYLDWDDLLEPDEEGDIDMGYGDDWEEQGRKPLADFKPGDEIEGIVVTVHMLHGAFVDVGAQYDAWIHVAEEDWCRVEEVLDTEVEVKGTVRAVRDPHRFRFPLEMDLAFPTIADLVTVPHPEYPPIFIYEGEHPDDAAAEAGRPPPPPSGYEEMAAAAEEEGERFAEEAVARRAADAKEARRKKRSTAAAMRGSGLLGADGSGGESEEEEEEEEEDDDEPATAAALAGGGAAGGAAAAGAKKKAAAALFDDDDDDEDEESDEDDEEEDEDEEEEEVDEDDMR